MEYLILVLTSHPQVHCTVPRRVKLQAKKEAMPSNQAAGQGERHDLVTAGYVEFIVTSARSRNIRIHRSRSP